MTDTDNIKHFTIVGYKRGCREPCCRMMNNAYMRGVIGEGRKIDRDPSHHSHGTRSGYKYYMCRCEECSRWNREDVARRVKRRKWRALDRDRFGGKNESRSNRMGVSAED